MELLRHEQAALEESLAAFPVVLLTGARQVGKTTLARRVANGTWRARYLTLDDPVVSAAARDDPDRFLASHEGSLVLDEVQAAPDLLRAIKLRVDREHLPGQYLLAGSANILAMRQVEESLAGRMAIHELLPLSLAELEQRSKPAAPLDALFNSDTAAKAADAFSASNAIPLPELQSRILAGGFPAPALTTSPRTRTRWFRSYFRTYVERDIPSITGIEYLGVFERLLRLLMLRSGNVLNVADLARTLMVPVTTLHRYVDLLSLTYQVVLLRPHASNAEKRVVKAPKVFGGDSGLTAALSGTTDWESLERDGRAGALFETWVCGELRKLISLSEAATTLGYWRTHDGREVDFVLQRGARVVGIEAKATARLGSRDLAGVRALAAAEPLHLGVIVYEGSEVLPLDKRLLAVPAGVFFS